VRIEFPDFFAGGGIDGDDVIVLRGEEEFALDEDGGGFEGGFVDEIGFDVECAEGPGDFELSDVGFVDLRGGGEARATRVAPVDGPGYVCGLLGLGYRAGRDGQKAGDKKRWQPALFFHSLFLLRLKGMYEISTEMFRINCESESRGKGFLTQSSQRAESTEDAEKRVSKS
jgi:hypothetical protein